MDVGSRFTLGERVNDEFLWNMSVIRDNPKLMLYKIKSSERKVTLNEELEKLAKKLHLKYDKETKQISVYDYSVLIKDSEIERKQEYENLINSNLITS
jgi:hypothetical protein